MKNCLAKKLRWIWESMMHIPAKDVVYKGKNAELYFETEEMEADLDKLKNWEDAVEILHDLVQPWGQRAVRFFDPDGHLIEIAESMPSVAIRFLREGKSLEATSEITMIPMEYMVQLQEMMKK